MDAERLSTALTALAQNHAWSWSPATQTLFEKLAPGGRLDRHPASLVGNLDDDDLQRLLGDHELISQVTDELSKLPDAGPGREGPDIAYFSPEFGLSELVPQYSGGLGILAGDHLKAASDLELALCGVGLFYRQGFFSQELLNGAQSERYRTYAPEDLGCIDTGHTVTVPFPGREVAAKVWRLDVGSIPLILLDTAVAAATEADRNITDRLYSGDRRHRLEQELMLGVGGARALHALGWDVGVHHLNEGHAGFLLLELLDRRIADGAGLDEAVAAIAPGIVFTTHTPVPAGIDRFEPPLATEYLDYWAERWKLPVGDLLALGTDPTDDPPAFNMAALCLRSAGRANGVSKLHGTVSRELFGAVPGGSEISSVTNGVHARTWVMPELQDVFDASLGSGWPSGDRQAWDRVGEIDDDVIRAVRHSGASQLREMVVDRTGVELDPDVLTVGFARRFATYKRATLLLRPAEALHELLADDDRPIQFVFAGKAHPADEPGKALLEQIVAFTRTSAANGRFVFVPDYEMAVARAMYAGCDVWLNNPVRPREASGTSGEKSALNGGLNCSISDGWWDEMADGRNGWVIPDSRATAPDRRDDLDAEATLAILRDDVRAEYYADGVPLSDPWLARVRHNWRTLGPLVTAGRMVADYRDQLYLPALEPTADSSTP